MGKTTISVAEAARSFADCVNRAHYQHATFVLLKDGLPFARLGPENEKVCLGRDLAAALTKSRLSADVAKASYRDLHRARATLKPPARNHSELATFNRRHFARVKGLTVIEPK